MYTKILIPLDGSKVSQQVLPYARLVARKLNLPVELLEVVDVVGLSAAVAACDKGTVESLIAETMRGSAGFLERISKTFSGVSVSCVVEQERAGEVIIEKGAADKGTLIAIATHGRSGIDRWLLGSVVEKVVRGTTNPLLLVRASRGDAQEGEATLKTIIVPLDGSPLAEKALPHAALLAKAMSSEMVLFSAYRLAATASGEYIPDWDKPEAVFKREAERLPCQ